MSLHDVIASANTAGRLGLIIYTIPRYPSPAIFEAVDRLLENSEGVSIVETTIPVTGGFSGHANQAIIEAHKVASSSGTRSKAQRDPESLDCAFSIARPSKTTASTGPSLS